MSIDSTALESLYSLAKAVCEEINVFKPDLVIGLAHSGWMPVHAIRALWNETRVEPFPPALRLNLGLEKSRIYWERKQASGLRDITMNYASEMEVGHFLAWIDEQLVWQQELKDMIYEVTGTRNTPERILIVDELISEGDTYHVALGLLNSTYPEADTRFVAGDEFWSYLLEKAWLEERAPALRLEIESKSSQGKLLNRAVERLILGTEDLPTEQGGVYSLRWRPICPETPEVQQIASYIPLAECLHASTWAEQRVANYIQQRHRGHLGQPEEEKRFRWGIRRPQLDPQGLFMRQLWFEGHTTPHRWAQITGQSPEAASQNLDKLSHEEDLQLRYLEEAELPVERRCYLPYLMSKFDDEPGKRPLIDVYWTQPGSLLAGPSPAVGPQDRLSERLTWLVDTGVTIIVDLTEPADHLPPYQVALGSDMKYMPVPLERFLAPDPSSIHCILSILSNAIETGETIYLCDLTGSERVGMVLGCWLVEQGWEGWKALEEINRLRLASQLTPVFGCPETRWQRDIVLSWNNQR